MSAYLPRFTKRYSLLGIVVASLIGSSVDQVIVTRVDDWLHDSAVVWQARRTWQYTGIVVLDDAVPMQVSRQQALPLFAKAAQQLIAAGVKGIFLDASLSKEMETLMPYAMCIEPNGDVRWSAPHCEFKQQQCHLSSSVLGNAPLQMPETVFERFKVAPYLPGQENLPDFLLYDSEQPNIVALDRLVKQNSAIARWLDLSTEHAVLALATWISPEQTAHSLAHGTQEYCEQQIPCRRIRFSRPLYTIQLSADKPILPVSQLASCDEQRARQAANLLRNRVVILQLTTPREATDVVITPFTTALLSPHLFTPGPQYLADAVETLLHEDHPRPPPLWLKTVLFTLAASLGVLASIYLQHRSWLWLIGFGLLIGVISLCYLQPLVQLWPIFATELTFIIGALQGIALHLYIGFKDTRLVAQYLPSQVHNLLFPLKTNEYFRNQRCQAIVLMSDLTGYTTVTGMLKEPSQVLELMNDYLSATAYVLQERYGGWLESYIGDMVCYYWPYFAHTADESVKYYANALHGAVALAQLQKDFFSQLPLRYQAKFDTTVLHDITKIINAGIGLSVGSVVMGDLGPKNGIRKFGILGDPMNLTARVESLTRFFNTEIIITAAFLPTANALHYPTRRLGCFCVKGRKSAETLYALGTQEDRRFEASIIDVWETWLNAEEQALNNPYPCPALFELDKRALQHWKARGLLQNKIWVLDEK